MVSKQRLHRDLHFDVVIVTCRRYVGPMLKSHDITVDDPREQPHNRRVRRAQR